MKKLFGKGTLFETEIKNGKNIQNIPVILNRDIYYPLKENEFTKIKASINLNENLSAPISHFDEIGELKINLENDLIFSQKLFTINIEKIKEESFFKKIIKAF